MILYLAVAHASIFNTRVRSLFIEFLCAIRQFLAANILGNFLIIQLCNVRATSQSVTIINVKFNVRN